MMQACLSITSPPDFFVSGEHSSAGVVWQTKVVVQFAGYAGGPRRGGGGGAYTCLKIFAAPYAQIMRGRRLPPVIRVLSKRDTYGDLAFRV